MIDVGIATDTHRRFASLPSVNEDAGLACVVPASPGTLGVLCVCDGVGGNLGGDRASQKAVRALLSRLADPCEGIDDLIGRLNVDWVESVHQTVAALAVPETRESPATTMAVALCDGHRVFTANIGDSRVYRLRGPAWPNTGRIEPLTFDNAPQDAFKESSKDATVEWALGAGDSPAGQWKWAEDRLEPGDAIFCCSDGLFPSGFSPVILDLLVTWAALNSRSAADFAALLVNAGHTARRGLTQERLVQPTGLRDDTTVAALTSGPLRPLGVRFPVWDPCWRPQNAIDVGSDAMGARLWRGALEDTLLREFLGGPWVSPSADGSAAFETEYRPRRRALVSLESVVQEPIVKGGEPRSVLRSRKSRRAGLDGDAAAEPSRQTGPTVRDLPGVWWVRLQRDAPRVTGTDGGAPLVKIGRTVVRLNPPETMSDVAQSPARRCGEVVSALAAVEPAGLSDTGAVRGWILGGRDNQARVDCAACLNRQLISTSTFRPGSAPDSATIISCLGAALDALLRESGCVAVVRNGREAAVMLGAAGELSTLWHAAKPLLAAAGLAEEALGHLLVIEGAVGLPACVVLDARENSAWEASSAESFVRLGACDRVVDLPMPFTTRNYRIGQHGWLYTGLPLDDEFASPYHAEAARNASGQIRVADLDSDNGTWILTNLCSGDEVLLADAAVVRCRP